MHPVGILRRLLMADCVWNVMVHAQKPDFFFRRKGRVHLNRRGRQFSRLLAAEVCASALVMLDTPRSELLWEYWLPTPFASFPFTSPPLRHCVPSCFKRTLKTVPTVLSNAASVWKLSVYCQNLTTGVGRHMQANVSTARRCAAKEDDTKMNLK